MVLIADGSYFDFFIFPVMYKANSTADIENLHIGTLEAMPRGDKHLIKCRISFSVS